MKKLIAISIASIISIMSSFAIEYQGVAQNEDEADAIKKVNETTVYARPFIDGRKFYILEGTYDAEIEKKINRSRMNKKDTVYAETVRFQVPNHSTSKVCAARDGVVISVVQDYKKNDEKVNYIIIYHGDKTYSQYTSLKAKSVKVRVGQKVTTGQLIATVGENEGTPWGQQMGLTVYYYVKGKDNKPVAVSLPVHFKINEKITTVKETDIF